MFFGYHPDAYWKPEDSFVRKVELTRTSSETHLPKAEEKKGVIGSIAKKNDEGPLSERNARAHSFDDMVEETQEEARTDNNIRTFGSMAEEEESRTDNNIRTFGSMAEEEVPEK
jgi:hypothetical protein